MMFCLAVAILQAAAAVQHAANGKGALAALMALYAATNVVLAWMGR